MGDDKIVPMSVWNSRWKRDEILASRRRIRRSGGLPDYLKSELERRWSYPYELTGVLPGYNVVYRRGRWVRLDTPQIDEPGFENLFVRIRTTVAWIRRGDINVASVRLREIDGELVPDWCFWDAMDNESQDLATWAEMILSLWAPSWIELFGYGPVLELQDVWVEPWQHQQGLWKPVAHALINRIMRKSSILAVHAFPEEYNGRAPEGARSQVAFRRRQLAMMRVCEKEFGLKAMPHWGDEGFMWRPRAGLERIVGTPEYDPDWE